VRLSGEEIAAAKARLSAWRTAEDMLAHANRLNDRMGAVDFFNQPGVSFIREAWGASTFAAPAHADRVRLTNSTRPDFELLFGARMEPFEFTEADEPGRQRGLEYWRTAALSRPGEPLVEDDPVENWIERAEQVPIALCEVARKKAAKGYAPGTSLLILLNINEFGIRQTEIEACFADATSCAKDRFESVWVLWKERACGVWRRGQASSALRLLMML
jgi:hypothetical protein